MIDAATMAKQILSAIEQHLPRLERPKVTPSEETLRRVLEEMFWSSMDQYEGQALRPRVYFAPEQILSSPNTPGVMRLLSPAPMDRKWIRRLCPAHGLEGALLVMENQNATAQITGLYGCFPSVRRGWPLWLCVECRGVGVIAVHVLGRTILEFKRGEVRAIGGPSMDRSGAIALIRRVLQGTAGHREAIEIASFFLDIGSMIDHAGTGGSLWILPERLVADAAVAKAGHTATFGHGWLEPFHELWEDRTNLLLANNDSRLEGIPWLWQPLQEWDFLKRDSVVKTIANLARIDGAIVMTPSPRVVTFGVVYNEFAYPAKEVLQVTDALELTTTIQRSTFGGSRHSSAIDFCSSHSPACAVVASHDGGITVFASWEPGKVWGGHVSMIENTPQPPAGS